MNDAPPSWPKTAFTHAEVDALLPQLKTAQDALDALRFQCLLPILDDMFTAAPEVVALSCAFDEEEAHASRLVVSVDTLDETGERRGMGELGEACFYLEEGSARRLDQLQDMLNDAMTRSPTWGVRTLVRTHLAGVEVERGRVHALRRRLVPDCDALLASSTAQSLDGVLPSANVRASSPRM